MKTSYLVHLLQYYCPPAIVSIVIFCLCCLIPADDLSEIYWPFFVEKDKAVHFLMYFGLAGVASFHYIYDKKGHIIVLKLIIFAILVPVLYGGLIEILQSEYFPGRSGDWYDFLADILGAFASLPFSLLFRRYLLNREIRKQEL